MTQLTTGRTAYFLHCFILFKITQDAAAYESIWQKFPMLEAILDRWNSTKQKF